MEATSAARPALPEANQLGTAARVRLAQELAQLPLVGSAAFLRTLQGAGEADAISSGTLVHMLRQAVARRDEAAARELFVLILRRVAGVNTAWARRIARRMWSRSAEARRAIEEELQQELTLHLWEQLAFQSAETWELFFRRSLDYAQRHVATGYMTRNGYWRDPEVAQPTRGLAILLSQLTAYATDEADGLGVADGAQQAQLQAAELADLRTLVANLPSRERIAVILRFWLQADEREIAEALGNVSTRTVRNVLGRAYALLRARYTGEGGRE